MPDTIHLTNTLSKSKDPLISHEAGVVRVYNCGPTVYSTQHIGNMRRYVVADLLRRTLEWNGLEVQAITNITDVGHLTDDDHDEGEDKIVKAAQREKLDPRDIALKYTKQFFEDLQTLNIRGLPDDIQSLNKDTPIEGWPRATEYIPQMITIVEKLLADGIAYETSKGIYFDLSQFPEYGALSGNTLEALNAGARVAVDSEKHHPSDFALWIKAPKEHLMQWDSPWGSGYPGWHIECTAMGYSLLGEYIDIHTGGVDNKFPHHENEIAQANSFLGHPHVSSWIHNEHLLLDDEKMSKSLGNVVNLRDVLETSSHQGTGPTYRSIDVRLYFLLTHYRSKMSFSWRGLDQAQTNIEKISAFLRELRNHISSDDTATSLDELLASLSEALYDDLNTPELFARLFAFIKSYHLDPFPLSPAQYNSLTTFLEDALGLVFFEQEIPSSITSLLQELDLARQSQNFEHADALREQITQQGYRVETTPDGSRAISQKFF